MRTGTFTLASKGNWASRRLKHWVPIKANLLFTACGIKYDVATEWRMKNASHTEMITCPACRILMHAWLEDLERPATL